jgi:hypothetical protein
MKSRNPLIRISAFLCFHKFNKLRATCSFHGILEEIISELVIYAMIQLE